MSTALAIPTAPLAKLVDRAREYAAAGRSGSTKKAYLSDFHGFEGWCALQGVDAMPARPEIVALHATALADAGRKVSTIERAVTTIAQLHRVRGIDWPRSHPRSPRSSRAFGVGSEPRPRKKLRSSTKSSSRCSRAPATTLPVTGIGRC